jgi:phosphate transport system permease protein
VRTRASSVEGAEVALAALGVAVLALVAGMVIFVFAKAWPSFSHNGIAWFGSGGSVETQLHNIQLSSPDHPVYHLRAFPLLYATVLTTGLAVAIALAFSVLTAVFIVEFAPPWMVRILEPTVRLLAAVPSIIYGLIGVLVLVPFVADHLISAHTKASYIYVVQLTGQCVLVAVLVLAVMIAPIMIAITVDALRAVPSGWTEGSAALGVNRWRTMRRIGLRTVRPAIIAGLVLATARALGEAIMLSLVASSAQSFSPNPLDGLNMFLEPAHPLAAAIVDNVGAINAKPLGQTLYAFALILLVSAGMLSLIGWAAKRPLRKYGIQA